MKINFCIICTVCLIVALASSTLFGQQEAGGFSPLISESMLEKADIGKIDFQKSMPFVWVQATNEYGKPVGTVGGVQEILVSGVSARIQFAEFRSSEEAQRAIKFHMENVPAMFNQGIWEKSANQVQGDEVWNSCTEQTTALLLRIETTCVLLSCRNADVERRKNVAERLAQCLARKLVGQ